MSETRYLELKWSVSRGRCTYGYNIVTLTDSETRKRYRAVGGGYDMTGTVFGEWLEDVYQDRLWAIREQAYAVRSAGGRSTNQSGLYGMTWTEDDVRLDGGCGLESMRRIAEVVGVESKAVVNKRGHANGYLVTDTRAVSE